ncbi:transforming growth factor beta-1-induced transcript 1 protein-like, partial [Mantella aurantiaca]
MEDLDALLADLQITSPIRCPVLLTDSQQRTETCEQQQRPPPPPYDPKTSVTYSDPEMENTTTDKSHLYSTVKKFSPLSPALGGGLCELDRLLNELNATQFNITDEIMSQFPAADPPEERRVLSASSATLELDRLMASLSDFHKQNTASLAQDPLSSAVESARSPPGIPEPVTDPDAAVLPANGAEECHVTVPANVQSEEAASMRCLESGPRSDLDSMMVKLQSGLKEQGIETHSKGLCHSCQRPIAGQVITALGHTWHPEHFVCSHCKSLIGNTNFFEKEGKPYCEKDYFTLLAPRCALCHHPILQ